MGSRPLSASLWEGARPALHDAQVMGGTRETGASHPLCVMKGQPGAPPGCGLRPPCPSQHQAAGWSERQLPHGG